ncbi:hypothetical protein [Sporichthya polymorpha]|uniref:hypothetical protein n=1 Tax=Sporichthya polymorpha TaxID=35751 RepID=UPI00036FD90B|nr:hypothetical protein [Sporichthya polymorpha]
MNRDRLLALAFLRGSIDRDPEVLSILMRENPPTPELFAQTVSLAAAMLEHGVGSRERATATIDNWFLAIAEADRDGTRAGETP